MPGLTAPQELVFKRTHTLMTLMVFFIIARQYYHVTMIRSRFLRLLQVSGPALMLTNHHLLPNLAAPEMLSLT